MVPSYTMNRDSSKTNYCINQEAEIVNKVQNLSLVGLTKRIRHLKRTKSSHSRLSGSKQTRSKSTGIIDISENDTDSTNINRREFQNKEYFDKEFERLCDKVIIKDNYFDIGTIIKTIDEITDLQKKWKRKQYRKIYEAKHIDKIKKYQQTYIFKNKEKNKEYRRENREKIRNDTKEYYHKNKEKVKEYQTRKKEMIQKYMREYYLKNGKRIKEKNTTESAIAYRIEYNKNNKEKIKRDRRRYYDNNRKKISESRKKHFAKNKEKYRKTMA